MINAPGKDESWWVKNNKKSTREKERITYNIYIIGGQ